MDPLFDKLTSICKRIFNVPVVLISLVDVVNQWIKSEVRLDIVQTDRNSAIYPCTELPSSPNVFVIADALSDDRYSQNPFAIELPDIRFYAEVPLFVEGFRVGSLCIADVNERCDFSQEDRLNLHNFGLAISSIIISRKKYLMKIYSLDALKLIDDRKCTLKNPVVDENNVTVDLMPQISKPRLSFQIYSSLNKSSQLELTNYLSEDINDIMLADIKTTSSTDIQLDTFVTANIQQLEEQLIQSDDITIHNSNNDNNNNTIHNSNNDNNNTIHNSNNDINNTIHDSNNTINYSINYNNIEIIPTLLPINELMSAIQTSLSSLFKFIEVEWNIDSQLTGATITSYPEIIKHILSCLIDKSDSYWKKANIAIKFRSFRNNNTKILSNKDNNYYFVNSNISNDNHNNNSGYLSVTINMSLPHDLTTATMTTTTAQLKNHISMHIEPIQKLLEKFGGNCRSSDFNASSSSSTSYESKHDTEVAFFEFDIPGELFISCNSNNNNNNNDNNLTTEVSNGTMTTNSCNPTSGIRTNLLAPSPSYSLKLRRQSSTISAYSEKSSDSSDSSYSYIHKNMMTTTLEQLLPPVYHTNNQLEEDDNNIIKLELWDPDYEILQQQQQQQQRQAPPLTEINKYESHCTDKYKKPYCPPSSSSSLATPSLRVLIIDDSTASCKLLRSWLQAAGCDVTLAATGKRCLFYLKTKQFDISFLDFIMPDMSGKDVLKQFQDWRLESCLNNINDDMLLVGMSANASQRDQQEAYNYDMHIFAAKPVDLDFLSIILSATSKFLSLPKVIKEIRKNTIHPLEPSDGTGSSSRKGIHKKKFRSRKASSVSCRSSCSSSSSLSSSFSFSSLSRAIVPYDQEADMSTTDENNPNSTTRRAEATASDKRSKQSQSPNASFFPPMLPFLNRLRSQFFRQFFSGLAFHSTKVTPHIEFPAAVDVDAVPAEA